MFPYLAVFLPAELWDRLLGRKPLQRVAETWDALTGRVFRAVDSLARAAPRLSFWALDYKPWVLRNVLAGLALVFVFVLNVGSVYPQMRWVGYVSWIGRDLNLYQKWSMFAPFPSREDGWWVIPAKLKDGSLSRYFSNNSEQNWKKVGSGKQSSSRMIASSTCSNTHVIPVATRCPHPRFTLE